MGKVWERLSRDVDVKVDIEGAAPNHIFVHNKSESKFRTV